MSATVSVHVDGLEEARAAFRKMPTEVRREMRFGIQRALTIVQDEMKQRIHSPAGHARGGLKQKITGSGAALKARVGPQGRGARAAVFSQRSRGPGRTPPPAGPLRRWANARGINVYALAKSIGRKGVRAHPVARSAYSAKRNELEHAFKAAIEGALRSAVRP